MQFTVLALTAAPDTQGGRLLHGLADLDDVAVGKILFHKRKQQAGLAAQLALSQQRIATLSLVCYDGGHAEVRTLGMPDHGEAAMLDTFFAAAKPGGRLVTWGGWTQALPLLRLRAMRHLVVAADFWEGLSAAPDFHLDLQDALSVAPATNATPLHELALLFGFPGLPDAGASDAWELIQAGDFPALHRCSTFQALNLYLLALRYWEVSGGLTRDAAEQARVALRGPLQDPRSAGLRGFLDAWTGA